MAYVDDILIKSSNIADHAHDLGETLETLCANRMKLNPDKCHFRVWEGKFVDFYIGKIDIRPNPEKVEVILNTTPPKTIREVQKLNGKINTLSCFISKNVESCKPFFQLLKARPKSPVEWTHKCEVAFTNLKEHLASLPTPTTPQLGEDLYLYVSASEEVVSVVLICQRELEQIPLYYHSPRLQGVETQYPPIESLVYVVIHAAHHFRAYFLAHHIKVFTVHPLRRFLHKLETSGRLTRWAIELSEYQIDYVPAAAIKGQAVADFIAELTQVDETIPWRVEVDGSNCSTGASIRIKIVTPDQRIHEHSIHLQFTM